jgi:hypothetical protein
MKHILLLVAAVVTAWTPEPAAATDGPLFRCDARAPNVCRFRIFYARGDRIVVLLPGMKQNIPGVTVGSDTYCVTINTNPRVGCTRKPVGAATNS